MEQEKLKQYTKRITNANRSELIVITYELFLEDVHDARAYYEEGKLERYQYTLNHSLSYLRELISSLDYHYEIASHLLQLYVFVNKQVILAKQRASLDELVVVEEIMTGLYQAFKEVAKQDTSCAMMKHTQQVYAGLTYAKGSLNEVSIGATLGHSGFQA